MVLLGDGKEVSTGGVTTVAAPERRVARRRKVPALAGRLDAGQPSRVRLPAATVAHSIGI
jgi:hypothetical protein